MINTDYPLEALEILLDKNCLPERYFPLIGHKERLIPGLRRRGCRTKSDAERLSDEDFRDMGLESPEEIRLFRRFLSLYDPKPQKLRAAKAIPAAPEERAAFRELCYLPGVKEIRATLYYRSGYRSLRDFAAATVEEVLERTARTIAQNALPCAAPLPKEVRTQIAVARAFTREPED